MNHADLTQDRSQQHAILSVAKARTQRAQALSRRVRAQWREHTEALQAERQTLLALDADIARIRPLAQPHAGRPAVAAATLLAWRDHAQDMLRLRGEQNEKVRTAAGIAGESREQARQAVQAALRADLKQHALAARLSRTQRQLAASVDDAQAEEQNDSTMHRASQRASEYA